MELKKVKIFCVYQMRLKKILNTKINIFSERQSIFAILVLWQGPFRKWIGDWI